MDTSPPSPGLERNNPKCLWTLSSVPWGFKWPGVRSSGPGKVVSLDNDCVQIVPPARGLSHPVVPRWWLFCMWTRDTCFP